MSRILIVDDKEMMRDSVATTLARKGHAITVANSGSVALQKIGSRSFDAVITDLQMPGMDGIELLEQIQAQDEQMPVVLMTAFGTIETAVAAMKQGAYDYITKPFTGDELLVAVERAIERSKLLRENAVLRAEASLGGVSTFGKGRTMIGNGPAMAALQERMRLIADSHGTVLISGESGSGKEIAARWIHDHSPRAKAPFLALNCAALSTNLLESELFGHERGAFTGADKLRKGRFELADGGTLLLDEISEIAPEVQAKLLRVLQEKTFERVGSSTARAVDVRVIATTNRDLKEEVGLGSFRQDLYFRLHVLPLCMPPLRDHPEDISALASHFLTEVARREGKPVKQMARETIDLLQRYGWPGNVRELQNICERAAVLTPDEVVSAGLLEGWLNAPVTAEGQRESHSLQPEKATATIETTAWTANPVSDLRRLICNGERKLDDIEREVIVATLEENRGHRQRSAKALGIGVRTLGLKLKKWKSLQLVAQDL